MRLSTFASEPQLVTIAGVAYFAPKLRVRDIAYLEDWFERVVPSPPEGDDAGQIEWPIAMGSAASARLLGSAEGLVQVVYASLRQLPGGMTIERARELAGSMATGEDGAFFIAVFPRKRRSKATEAAQDTSRCEPMNWHAGVMRLIKRHNYTPDQCFDMPVDTFFGMFEDPDDDDSEDFRPAKKWDIPIGTPDDLGRLWAAYEKDGKLP